MKLIYPWQNQQWQTLCEGVKNNSLSHAMLFFGNIGLGKNQFAKEFAKYLLCSNKIDNGYCNQCNECILYQAGNHPDFDYITTAEDSQVIKIDQIREISTKITQTASRTNAKVIIIHPVEAMNQACANALLKSLEEPTANVFFILVTNQNSQLPATIRSRCLHVKFLPLNEEQNNAWLKQFKIDYSVYFKDFSAQSPLLAKLMIEEKKWQILENLLEDLHALSLKITSAVTIAEKWQKQNIKDVITWMVFWLNYIIANQRIHISDSSQQCTFIANISKQKTLEQWFSYLDYIYEQQRYLNAKINLNSQMLLESIFLKFN